MCGQSIISIQRILLLFPYLLSNDNSKILNGGEMITLS